MPQKCSGGAIDAIEKRFLQNCVVYLMQTVERNRERAFRMDAVIFDLDGTLWDATGCACAVWNRVLERHREVLFHMTGQRVAQLMGKPWRRLARRCLGMLTQRCAGASSGSLKRKRSRNCMRMAQFYMTAWKLC